MVIKNTNDCSGCGGCTYSEFIDEISVDKIFYTGKEINKISFHSVLDTDKVYVLTIEQLTALNLKFEIIEFEVLNSKFNLKLDTIESGSCTPWNYKSIKKKS
jgi:hypothetical protein